MKTVYIVRHAKSSWEYKGIEDIDRPLKKRGIRDSYLMASALKGKIEKPAVFITSSATRALSTAVIFSNVFGFPLSNLQIKKSLYNFSDGYLVKTIKALDDEFDSAIIFSHDHGRSCAQSATPWRATSSSAPRSACSLASTRPGWPIG